MSTEPKIEKIHCNDCGQKTRHALLHMNKQDFHERNEGEYDFWACTIYRTWQCQGCESVTLVRTITHSEMGHDENPDTTYYPPRVSRKQPAWLDSLDGRDQLLLKEVYTALHADSRSLAMMGARALFDAFIQRNVGDVKGGFTGGIQKLLEEGFITKFDQPLIEAAIEAGNAAAHRGHRPKKDQLEVVMNILENLLHQELLRHEAEGLKKATPQRIKPVKASKAEPAPAKVTAKPAAKA